MSTAIKNLTAELNKVNTKLEDCMSNPNADIDDILMLRGTRVAIAATLIAMGCEMK